MVYIRVLIIIKLPQIYTFTRKILLNFTKFGSFRIMFQAIQISLYKYKASKNEDQNNKNQLDALFYSQFISILNLYMFRAYLLLFIRRHYSVYTAIGLMGLC